MNKIDIFNTNPRKLIGSLLGTTQTTEHQPPEPSFNISYPTSVGYIPIQNTPGPGAYQSIKKQHIPRIHFSKSNRSALIPKPFTALGPGSFTPIKPKATSVRIGTALRPPLSLKTCTPGPCYEVKSKVVETQGNKIGNAQRYDFTKEKRGLPAPGCYEPKIQAQVVKYSIGKSERHDFTKEGRDNPGPVYEIVLKPSTPAFKFGTCKRN